MPQTILTSCPVCSSTLHVTRLHCPGCHTTIENTFQFSRLSLLPSEQLMFIEVFIKCRGNIKEVEKELGISYPTVRGKLDDIIAALGYSPQKKADVDKRNVISMLEEGQITPDEALQILKKERD